MAATLDQPILLRPQLFPLSCTRPTSRCHSQAASKEGIQDAFSIQANEAGGSGSSDQTPASPSWHDREPYQPAKIDSTILVPKEQTAIMANPLRGSRSRAIHVADWKEKQEREFPNRLVPPSTAGPVVSTETSFIITVTECLSQVNIASSRSEQYSLSCRTIPSMNASRLTSSSTATPSLIYSESDMTRKSDTETQQSLDIYERFARREEGVTRGDIEAYNENETNEDSHGHQESPTHIEVLYFLCIFLGLGCRATFETREGWEDHLLGHFKIPKTDKRIEPPQYSLRCPNTHCTILPRSGVRNWVDLIDHISHHHAGGRGLDEERSDQFLYDYLGRKGIIPANEWMRLTSKWNPVQCTIRDPRKQRHNREQ